MKLIPLLKFVYRGLLTGLPILTYNPITKLNFHCPFNVLPNSTYINFKLDQNQVEYLNNYIDNPKMKLDKVLIENNKKDFYLSVNIYNCSVPIIPSKDDVTRCEINTYVFDKDESKGTVILDYESNALSMDPVNIFKSKGNVSFTNNNEKVIGLCKSDNLDLQFECMYNNKDKNFRISDNLIEYSDKIFYTNSIYDKLFYDSSLTKANIKSPNTVEKIYFKFGDLIFDNPDSIFYFTENINFAGSIWNNLYDIE
tara:strand:- start:675 stop:1436 length:762 start_codon:yes stop_codon:yes gene_type:complete